MYLELRANFDAYRALFTALGFQMVEHARGFYYFRSDAELGKEALQFAVFFFILVEAWGDEGMDLEAAAFDPNGHLVTDLPHFSRESWRQCLREAEAGGETELLEIVGRLVRYGFAERLPEDRIRFRVPVWRFFDLCLDLRGEVAQLNGAST
jgi:hypothetical protein